MNSLLMKRCTKCGKEFPATTEYFYALKTGKYGITSWCKSCQSKYSVNRVRSWRKENPGQYKGHLLKYKFGLSIEEYTRMFNKQNGKCAICGKEETERYKGRIKFLAVDHNHKTGQIRGLLCHNCNRLLGLSYESQETLMRAAKYLEEWNA